MAYQTGSVSDFPNLVATLKTFASNNGWSVSTDIVYKGNVFARVAAEHPSGGDACISVQGGTGQSGGALTGAHGRKNMMRTHTGLGDIVNSFPITYHLFSHTSPDQITLFVNYNSIWWQWLTFGEIEKYGSYTGGQFYASMQDYSVSIYDKDVKITAEEAGNYDAPAACALFWGGKEEWGSLTVNDGGYMHLELDGYTWWLSSRETGYDGYRINTPSFMSPLLERCNSTSTEMTALLPYYVWALRPSSKVSLLGSVKHFRLLRIDNYQAGDIITIGSDRYKVFPWLRKTIDTIAIESSGVWGVAIEYDGP